MASAPPQGESVALARFKAAVRRVKFINKLKGDAGFKIGVDVDLDEKPTDDGSPMSALNLAAFSGDLELVAALMSKHSREQVSLNHKDELLRTPIHWAATGGHVNVLTWARDHNTDVAFDSQDRARWTPLFFAALHGHEPVIDFLLQHKLARIANADRDGWSALHWAASQGRVECCHRLLASMRDAGIAIAKDYSNRTALHVAAGNGQLEVCSLLAKEYAASSEFAGIQDREGRTALHYAVGNEQPVCLSVCCTAPGAPINVRDEAGGSPLHYAVFLAKQECSKILLSHHASTEVRDVKGSTPLHWVVERADLVCARALLDAGADLGAKDSSNKTPLHWACETDSPSIELITVFLNRGAQPNARDADLRSSVHYTAATGQTPVLQALFQAGADVNAVDNAGNAAAHFSSLAGNLEYLRALAKCKADFELQDGEFRRPLHWAAGGGHVECVLYLLKLGVQRNPQDMDRWTPLDWAIDGDFPAVIRVLQEAGAQEGMAIDVRAAVLIQSRYRGYAVRREKTRELNAVLMIQKHVRGWKVRKGISVKRTFRDGMGEKRAMLGARTSGSKLASTASTRRLATTASTRSLRSARSNISDISRSSRNLRGIKRFRAAVVRVKLINRLRGAGDMKLGRDIDMNEKPRLDGSAQSLLNMAAFQGDLERVKSLLAGGKAKLAGKDQLCRTALHWACAGGAGEVVQHLLGASAHHDVVDSLHWTPLFLAALHGHAEICGQLIAAGAAARIKDRDGWSPLHWSASQNQVAACEVLWPRMKGKLPLDAMNRSPVHVATANGQVDAVEFFAKIGADIGSKDVDHRTPMHYAVGNDQPEVLRVLAQHGAQHVSTGDQTGATPLHFAAFLPRLQCERVLLDAGANVDAVDDQGDAPLHWSASKGGIEAVSMLLAESPDVNKADYYGKTPLHWAIEAADGVDQDVVEALLAAGADANATENEGRTPIHYVAATGCTPVLQSLCNAGGNTNARDNDGTAAIHFASMNAPTEFLDTLLSNGADINLVDASGRSPAHWAAGGGRLDLLRVMIDAGAALCVQDSDRWTALDWALDSGQAESVETLRTAGDKEGSAIDIAAAVLIQSRFRGYRARKATSLHGVLAIKQQQNAWKKKQGKDKVNTTRDGMRAKRDSMAAKAAAGAGSRIDSASLLATAAAPGTTAKATMSPKPAGTRSGGATVVVPRIEEQATSDDGATAADAAGKSSGAADGAAGKYNADADRVASASSATAAGAAGKSNAGADRAAGKSDAGGGDGSAAGPAGKSSAGAASKSSAGAAIKSSAGATGKSNASAAGVARATTAGVASASSATAAGAASKSNAGADRAAGKSIAGGGDGSAAGPAGKSSAGAASKSIAGAAGKSNATARASASSATAAGAAGKSNAGADRAAGKSNAGGGDGSAAGPAGKSSAGTASKSIAGATGKLNASAAGVASATTAGVASASSATAAGAAGKSNAGADRATGKSNAGGGDGSAAGPAGKSSAGAASKSSAGAAGKSSAAAAGVAGKSSATAAGAAGKSSAAAARAAGKSNAGADRAAGTSNAGADRAAGKSNAAGGDGSGAGPVGRSSAGAASKSIAGAAGTSSADASGKSSAAAAGVASASSVGAADSSIAVAAAIKSSAGATSKSNASADGATSKSRAFGPAATFVASQDTSTMRTASSVGEGDLAAAAAAGAQAANSVEAKNKTSKGKAMGIAEAVEQADASGGPRYVRVVMRSSKMCVAEAGQLGEQLAADLAASKDVASHLLVNASGRPSDWHVVTYIPEGASSADITSFSSSRSLVAVKREGGGEQRFPLTNQDAMAHSRAEVDKAIAAMAATLYGESLGQLVQQANSDARPMFVRVELRNNGTWVPLATGSPAGLGADVCASDASHVYLVNATGTRDGWCVVARNTAADNVDVPSLWKQAKLPSLLAQQAAETAVIARQPVDVLTHAGLVQTKQQRLHIAVQQAEAMGKPVYLRLTKDADHDMVKVVARGSRDTLRVDASSHQQEGGACYLVNRTGKPGDWALVSIGDAETRDVLASVSALLPCVKRTCHVDTAAQVQEKMPELSLAEIKSSVETSGSTASFVRLVDRDGELQVGGFGSIKQDLAQDIKENSCEVSQYIVNLSGQPDDWQVLAYVPTSAPLNAHVNARSDAMRRRIAAALGMQDIAVLAQQVPASAAPAAGNAGPSQSPRQTSKQTLAASGRGSSSKLNNASGRGSSSKLNNASGRGSSSKLNNASGRGSSSKLNRASDYSGSGSVHVTSPSVLVDTLYAAAAEHKRRRMTSQPLRLVDSVKQCEQSHQPCYLRLINHEDAWVPVQHGSVSSAKADLTGSRTEDADVLTLVNCTANPADWQVLTTTAIPAEVKAAVPGARKVDQANLPTDSIADVADRLAVLQTAGAYIEVEMRDGAVLPLRHGDLRLLPGKLSTRDAPGLFLVNQDAAHSDQWSLLTWSKDGGVPYGASKVAAAIPFPLLRQATVSELSELNDLMAATSSQPDQATSPRQRKKRTRSSDAASLMREAEQAGTPLYIQLAVTSDDHTAPIACGDPRALAAVMAHDGATDNPCHFLVNDSAMPAAWRLVTHTPAGVACSALERRRVASTSGASVTSFSTAGPGAVTQSSGIGSGRNQGSGSKAAADAKTVAPLSILPVAALELCAAPASKEAQWIRLLPGSKGLRIAGTGVWSNAEMLGRQTGKSSDASMLLVRPGATPELPEPQWRLVAYAPPAAGSAERAAVSSISMRRAVRHAIGSQLFPAESDVLASSGKEVAALRATSARAQPGRKADAELRESKWSHLLDAALASLPARSSGATSPVATTMRSSGAPDQSSGTGSADAATVAASATATAAAATTATTPAPATATLIKPTLTKPRLTNERDSGLGRGSIHTSLSLQRLVKSGRSGDPAWIRVEKRDNQYTAVDSATGQGLDAAGTHAGSSDRAAFYLINLLADGNSDQVVAASGKTWLVASYLPKGANARDRGIYGKRDNATALADALAPGGTFAPPVLMTRDTAMTWRAYDARVGKRRWPAGAETMTAQELDQATAPPPQRPSAGRSPRSPPQRPTGNKSNPRISTDAVAPSAKDRAAAARQLQRLRATDSAAQGTVISGNSLATGKTSASSISMSSTASLQSVVSTSARLDGMHATTSSTRQLPVADVSGGASARSLKSVGSSGKKPPPQQRVKGLEMYYTQRDVDFVTRGGSAKKKVSKSTPGSASSTPRLPSVLPDSASTTTINSASPRLFAVQSSPRITLARPPHEAPQLQAFSQQYSASDRRALGRSASARSAQGKMMRSASSSKNLGRAGQRQSLATLPRVPGLIQHGDAPTTTADWKMKKDQFRHVESRVFKYQDGMRGIESRKAPSPGSVSAMKLPTLQAYRTRMESQPRKPGDQPWRAVGGYRAD